MVLNELGRGITSALAAMANTMVIDEVVLDECLKEICKALLQSDVNVRLVANLRTNIKKRVNVEELAAGLNKRKIIEKAVFDELCAMLDGGDAEREKAAKDKAAKDGASGSYGVKKGKPHVVMFVGLQGSGKTTTCTKYAYYHKKKGFKPALVCADTFRAGAFDQLKQNATKAQIPFYGSYEETDPAVIAQQGVELFRNDGRDLIIVDTSGRHKQEAALFEEMRQVAEAVKPDLAVFVMDGSIGQAAFDQAKAFKESVEVGAVIVTKLDGHAKGGGALSAVAATKSPVIFYGTGEHIDQFETFETRRFVSRLLGRGDVGGLMDKIQDVIPEDKQPELLETISRGNVTMRVMRDVFESFLNMGPVSQIMGMIPGFNADMFGGGASGDRQSQLQIKRYITIIESMTEKELDTTNLRMLQEPSRVERLARGSGRGAQEVFMLLEAYKHYAKYATQALKAANIPKNLKGKGDIPMNPRHMQQTMQRMAGALPPQLLKQMGGASGLTQLMKSMEQMQGGGMMPGGGGGGGGGGKSRK
ncbi:MAG: subunit of the signal recognition particle [Monoraphidium minutum]|nr:MAG: subunit of the signal recognition particle [Monoraphidium minutum]